MIVLALFILAAAILMLCACGWPWGSSGYAESESSIQREVREYLEGREGE